MFKITYPWLSAIVRILSTRFWPLQMVALCALGILLMFPPSVHAQKPQGKGKPKPIAANPKATIEKGRALFLKSCSPCHGASGQGGEGPNLQQLTLTEAIISTTVRKGVKGEMPAFGSRFKEVEMKALAAFVRSIKK